MNLPLMSAAPATTDQALTLTRTSSPVTPEAMQDWMAQRIHTAIAVEETSRLILDSAGEGIYGLDLRGFVTFVNPAACRMTGWDREDLEGQTQHSLLHHLRAEGSHYEREVCPIDQVLLDGQVQHREDEVFWRKDGTCFPVAYTSTPLRRDGAIVGAVVVFRDITEQARAHQWEKNRLRIFESILAAEPIGRTLQLLTEALLERMPGVQIAFHTRNGNDLTCLAASGMKQHERRRLDRVPMNGEEFCARAAFQGTTYSNEGVGEGETRSRAVPLISKSGETLGVLSLKGTPAALSATTSSVVQQALDFAQLSIERMQLNEAMKHQAQHDHLTGLPNRMLLEDRLEQALKTAKRRRNMVGVCYIDLDGFKAINDTKGHGVGDQYLQRVTETLRGQCRQVDTLARQGGDEFILVLTDLASPEDAVSVAERLLRALRVPFLLEGETFRASASVGISVYPQHGVSSMELLQNADAALYAAKRMGRDQASLYQATLGLEIRRRATLCSALHTALERGELYLNYQPLFARDMSITGFEALLRWQHPELGLVPPDQFIPVAEETGLIVPIGAWVLQETTRQMVEWQKECERPLRMYVNVSGAQLSRPGLPEQVKLALEQSGLPASQLELEITESWMVSDTDHSNLQLERLRSLGVSIAIDDFGIGQSSLSCLNKMRLDTLKIDRSFIARITEGGGELSTVQAIVTLAHQLGLRTVAEGVENAEQREALCAIQCDMLQGFLMSRPLPAAAARELLRENRAGVAA